MLRQDSVTRPGANSGSSCCSGTPRPNVTSTLPVLPGGPKALCRPRRPCLPAADCPRALAQCRSMQGYEPPTLAGHKDTLIGTFFTSPQALAREQVRQPPCIGSPQPGAIRPMCRWVVGWAPGQGAGGAGQPGGRV